MAEEQMLDRDEVFRHLLAEARIPILAVDLPDLLEFVAHPQAEERANYPVHLDVPRKDRRTALVAALRGLIGPLEVPGFAVDLFARPNAFASIQKLSERLRALAISGALWAIVEQEDHLRWEGGIALASWLSQVDGCPAAVPNLGGAEKSWSSWPLMA